MSVQGLKQLKVWVRAKDFALKITEPFEDSMDIKETNL